MAKKKRTLISHILFCFALVIAFSTTMPARAEDDFSVRANLLRWATLTPDLGIEWRMNRNLGIVVHGTATSWGWDHRNRRYALWEVTPEFRFYLGGGRRGYVGALYKTGFFNLKLSDTGRQGSLNGYGVTGGYLLPLGKRLCLDFSLGLGYVHAHFDRYQLIEGVRTRTGRGTKDRFGPINAGVTLGWSIF